MTATNTQVLTFTLGEERYCIDIDHVAEIVDGGTLTPVPNTAEHIKGVMDLRGRTTTIVDPYTLMDTDQARPETLLTDGGDTQNRVVVLDSTTGDSDGSTGWIVSDVKEVADVAEEDLDTSTVGNADLLRGLIETDDGFTLWLDPNKLHL